MNTHTLAKEHSSSFAAKRCGFLLVVFAGVFSATTSSVCLGVRPTQDPTACDVASLSDHSSNTLEVALKPQPAGPVKVQIPYGDNPNAGQYMQVNGIRLYVEIYGDGPPMLQIHGNGDSIAGISPQIEHFSKHYRVIVADSRGHGKSDMGDRRLEYNIMASDYDQLLERLGVKEVHLFGWSDGGIVGLLLARDYPDKVSKLAIMGAALRPDGAYDYAPKGVMRDLEVVESKISEGLDLKYWKAVRQQLLMCIEEPNIPNFTLKRIQAPTLVMAGDRDLIIDTHTLEIFNALPNAQLCIFPGATHAMPVEDPLAFNAVMERFFRNPFSRPESRDFFKDPDFRLSGPER